VHPWADWAAWHLPCGPVGLPSRWAATSNVEVGRTTYPVNRESVERARREGSEGQSHIEEEREGGSGTGEGAKGPLAQEGEHFSDICAGSHCVPSYAAADGAGLPN